MKKVFCCKMECRSLFCYWKIQQQIAIPKQRLQQQRAQTERRCCALQFVQNEESVS